MCSLSLLCQSLELVERPLKMRWYGERPHVHFWYLVFITYKLVAPLTSSQVFATSLRMDTDEGTPMRSGRENFLTGVAKESQVRRKKSVVRRRLVPPSKGLNQRDPPVPVLIESEPCLNRLFMRVRLLCICGFFQYFPSFERQYLLLSFNRPVYCRSCLYNYQWHRSAARVFLLFFYGEKSLQLLDPMMSS